jgi:site-specific recombinase
MGVHLDARSVFDDSAAIGAVVWAFEVEGFWQTIGVLLIGLQVFIATLPIALAQALRAIADVGDTVSAR